ncbi:MAG: geranylgeranylglycerol-phosphate geranylgeranyltransferase [Niabella sp.]
MTKTAAFFKLVRLPNLVFIVLTQVLFQVCIYYPIYTPDIPLQDWWRFALLVTASVLIAAGGYIINDYFDINIDVVNKPDKLIVNKHISRRWAQAWHLIFSLMGVLLTAMAVELRAQWYLIIANFASVILLWLYSVRFKRDVLIGNIVISLLTAWTILIIFLSKYSLHDAFHDVDLRQLKLFRFAILYAGFAFIISLVREAVKDVEDMAGDARYGCRTMPIIWGVNVTKVYVAVWLTILTAMLVIVQFYVLQFGWWIAVLYCFFMITLPLGYIFIKMLKASATQDFAALSSLTKLTMLSGILSMILFYIYL